MNTNINLLALAGDNQLILEIPQEVKQNANFVSHVHRSTTSCDSVYINKLCFLTVLPWIQEDIAPQAKSYPSITDLPSFWELVNGTAIDLIDGTRLVLVPTKAIDSEELQVPQEWVDIPSWIGDYYLFVQVEPEANYVIISGYCTHAQLKNYGRYCANSRIYSLESTQIINDISTLLVARQLCPENTRTSVPPIGTISVQQAHNLIVRLGDTQIVNPRLKIPFQLWSALLEHDRWRKRLFERRLSLVLNDDLSCSM